jgi:integrase
MSVRYVRQRDHRYGIVRAFWLVDITVRHRDGHRERVRKISPFGTRRGAEDHERRLRVELAAAARDQRPTRVSFAAFAKTWLNLYPAAACNRPSTVREKEQHVRVHLVPAFGGLRLDEIGGAELDAFMAALTKAGRSAKTIVNISSTLRRMLASAVEWRLLDAIPAIRRLRVPESPTPFLTAPEAARLVNAARNEEERALLLFALHTGARAGELLAVEWRDIEAGQVVFRRSLTRGIVGPTKSGRERSVPLTKTLSDSLGRLPRRGARIFVHPDGRSLSLNALHRRLRPALARAGLAPMRFSATRHSFASILVLGGAPIRQVQALLGHRSIATTLRYAHLAPGRQDQSLAALEMLRMPPLLAAAS